MILWKTLAGMSYFSCTNIMMKNDYIFLVFKLEINDGYAVCIVHQKFAVMFNKGV